jgi:hypothetical protein
MLLVSDQGAAVSVNSGRTWSSWYNQPTAQLYHAIATNDFPYKVCGGQQESGSVCIASRGNDGAITFRDWHPVAVIEYGYVAPDPLNNDVIYGSGRGQVSRYRHSTGQVQMITPSPLHEEKYRSARTQPIVFSPVDPHIMFYGANFVFKSADGGNSWQTISPDLARAKNGIPPNLGAMAAGDPEAEKKRGIVYSLSRKKSDGRFPRSVEMITQRPVMGSLRNSGKAGLLGECCALNCTRRRLKKKVHAPSAVVGALRTAWVISFAAAKRRQDRRAPHRKRRTALRVGG